MNPKTDFAFCNSMQVSSTEEYIRKVPSDFIGRLQEDYRNLFSGNHIGAPSDTIYRKCDIFFDEMSNWASDLEWYLHILSKNANIAYTLEPLISIGLHDDQYTHSFEERDERIFKDYYYIFEKYHLIDSKYCRKYFLKEFLLKYKKKKVFIFNMGYPKGEYIQEKWKYTLRWHIYEPCRILLYQVKKIWVKRGNDR